MAECCKELYIGIKKGNSMSYTFEFLHNLEPLVLEAGQKLLFDIKKNTAAPPIIHKDITAQGTGIDGEFVVTLKPSETDIPVGRYYLGFGLQDGADSEFLTIADGVFEVLDTAAQREVTANG